jgi:hypothetical protein
MEKIEMNGLNQGLSKLARTFALLGLALTVCTAGRAGAQITVTATGPSGSQSQTVAGTGGAFDLSLPLAGNAINTITVTAVDSSGDRATQDVKVTQLSLDQVVVSQVTTQQLTTQQVKQLVADGTIQLDNPANYNVSNFNIVLTIGSQPVQISLPVATPIDNTQTGYETYQMPGGEGGGGGGSQNQPPQIVIFDQPVPATDQISNPPHIPGVIIIEGSIKSLKEFYTVRLLLMNTSSIFTLQNVTASISFPDGGLTAIAPDTGVNTFGDIVPGGAGQPGQAEQQFIIRGDAIGVKHVQVSFGGTIAGPGIGTPVPFNGSAMSSVTVNGPPTFQVQVLQPDTVTIGTPYDLQVNITNTGQTDALYASLSLGVGAAGNLVDCEGAGSPSCAQPGGPETRTLGDIAAGQTVSATFTIDPLVSGAVSSCFGVSDQNISLQVLVGANGCLAGTLPPATGAPAGVPTVSIVPSANALGVAIDSPVTAFFSQLMDTTTITTGANGSFNVYDPSGNIVPGQLTFTTVNGNTVAIWQDNDTANNDRLISNTQYSVSVTATPASTFGSALYNAWTSRFTTTGTALDDTTPPTLTLTVEPSVDPSYVLPGQLVVIDAYASDQGSGVARVEMRIKDLTAGDTTYTLIDRKVVFSGDMPPFLFTIDSSKLVAGDNYQLMGTAYDVAGNSQNATVGLSIASSAAPPTIQLPAPPANGVLQGISVSLTPTSVTGGVRSVNYYLDGATVSFATVNLPPYQASLNTLMLALGTHSILAVATDGLGQTGSATYTFNLVTNPNKPQIALSGTTNGATYIAGSSFAVNGSASDQVGIASLAFTLDGSPVANGSSSFVVSTSALSLGTHQIVAQATNDLGVSSTLATNFNVVALPNGPPPAAPTVANVTVPANGQTTVTGLTAAGARVDVSNATRSFTVTVYADANGNFSASLAGQSGDTLQLVAYDYTVSQQPSAAATAVVPAPPALDHIAATITSSTFTAVNEYHDITVTGYYKDNSTADLTTQSTYTSSDTTVAVVSAAGRVVALKSGSVVITVSCLGQQTTVPVSVNIVTIASITADPATINFTAITQTQALTVTGHFSDGSASTLTSGVSFASSDVSIATVNSSGMVSPVTNGTAQIAVSYPGAQPISVNVIANLAVLPPTTQITAVADPGSSVSTTVTYQVLSGLSALDHVEIYYRRNGIGTFNRYMDSSSPQGKYQPQSGATGTMTFDSTQLGGDGSYEFYSIGVDTAGNREPAHSTADQTATFNAGTVWTTLTAPTTISATDASYDNQNIRVQGTTLTVTGTHSFQNVDLLNGATLTHPATTPTVESSMALTVWSLAVDKTSAISASGLGYLGGFSGANQACPGLTLGNQAGSTYRSAGSYGGLGAQWEGTSNPVYGSMTSPAALGSGGSCGAGNTPGGIGGGWVSIHATNIANDGTISANGTGGQGNWAGSGSGGSVAITTSTLSGAGTIQANGGVSELGGGGGRIAVNYTDLATFDTTHIQSLGGAGNIGTGADGTVLLKQLASGNGALVIDGYNAATGYTSLTVPAGYVFDSISLLNGARVVADQPIHVSGTLSLTGGSILTHSTASTAGLSITANRVEIDSTSSIDVSSRGYQGGFNGANQACPGITLGGLSGATYRSGGSYGGYGGWADGPGSNPPHGQPSAPIYLGSGGSCGAGNSVGGNGGGLVQITAADAVVVDGAILANGGGGAGNWAGSGSGGSIAIATSTLQGQGTIAANGGVSEVGGSGGRVAIRYTTLGASGDDLNGLRNIQAFGGHGNIRAASAGTVLLQLGNESYGDLYIDDNVTGATAPNWTPLTPIGFAPSAALTANTLTTSGAVPLAVNGLVGLEINPNISQSQTYFIVSNTATTITVDTTGKPDLTAIAAVGDTYAGVNRFDNVFFRRGGYLTTGDLLLVTGTMKIDEYGVLSHMAATPTFEPHLDLTVGTLQITSIGAITANGLGYLGGFSGANQACPGLTLGNQAGSTYRSAGSYGGLGAQWEGTSNPVYGSMTSPAALGSGGSCGAGNTPGGIGGGWVSIHATNIANDGTISANGTGGQGNWAGSGSGGSVAITTSTLSGAGTIQANGGVSELGGGGGRIALTYSGALGIPKANITANGGAGNVGTGSAGTINPPLN